MSLITSGCILVLLLVSSTRPFSLKATEDVRANQLGCVKCHDIDKNKINVHLVPHSHDDVGWLKTVDQYYYGLRTDIQHAGVQYIITSVVEALLENADRRYIQVETAFFWKWWKSQDDDMREKFKSLVDNGQIEIVNGAWSMNDEACANYQSTIDQFTWGLRTINETLGICGLPRVGWQIDPFGHSREQASIFAQLGFDGVFFARLDHDDKTQRQLNGTLDFAWQGSANLDSSTIFGGIFPTALYFPPNGYCWDWGCNDAPVIDDETSPDYNVKYLVSSFKIIINRYKKYFPTNNVFIPMGGDFMYEAAEMNYINMDRFIKAFRDEQEFNVIYSTPSCYIQAVNDAKPTLKLKTDDFFPYSNDDHSFWTGYFTSRPNSKRFERIGHNILQAAKQLLALNEIQRGSDEDVKSLQNLREVMGILQHHDAITGTEKQHVANDYVRLLTKAIETAEEPLGVAIGNLLRKSQTDVNLQLSSCLLANVSICSVTQQSEKFVVAVYNPLSWPVTHFVRLPINRTTFTSLTIQGPDGVQDYDIVESMPYAQTDLKKLQSKHDLVFAANEIPPMGIKLYYATQTNNKAQNIQTESKRVTADELLTFGDTATSFQINNSTNLLNSITMNGITIDITQNFYYYYSETGISDKTNISSGAYLFRPTNTTPESLNNGVTKVAEVRGKLVEEFHQKWNDDKIYISQIIRVYKNESFIEFDWLVGGINITDDMGKEVITRYSVSSSSFKTNSTFYTDSNGREMIKRTLNSRPDYTYNATNEPIASNYYPVTSKIVIKDSNIELAVLTDRPQGGSSLNDGEIELMIHRRILHDDLKGVDESLNETEFGTGVYVRGTHYLVFGSATKLNPDGKTTAAQERILAQKKLVQPWIGVGSATSDNLTLAKLQDQLNFNYSALTKALPENVNILTFEPWGDESYILRLEHILEKDEDPSLSNNTVVDLNAVFNSVMIHEITETTLAANQRLEDYQMRTKYTWNTTGEKMDVIPDATDPSKTTVSVTPMKIRTFVVKFHPQHSFGNPIKPTSTIMVFAFIFIFIMRPDIQRASVQNIITSVVEALLENSNRRFVQVETAFFYKWWNSQNDDMKNNFKYLVDNGQIEMVNGAWSMNDEACTNYQSTIDQFTWGLRTINDTLGACGIPRIGWQIDPFGHSREQASIYSQLGYDGVFFARMDYVDREKRRSEGSLNFAWQGSANLDTNFVFGGIFPNEAYGAPPGFCWDYTCNDPPVYVDPESPEYNLDEMTQNFTNIMKTYAQYYPSNHILIPMGGDFTFEAAEKNYINMDRFIMAMRDNSEVNVLYSTPSCYIKAVNDEDPELKLKTDDFFPYSDKKHSFWTGYFTSRPNSKRFERIGHNILQATKQLIALNGLKGSNYENNIKSLESLRDIMGVMQHHDAITGTERQHVTNDYVRQLTRAIENAEKTIGTVIGELLRIDQNETLDLDLKLSSCLLTNVSICGVTQKSERFIVAVYNPLAWSVTHHIRLPVENATYKIEGPDGEESYDILSSIPYFDTDISNQSSNSELLFTAKDIPPMGLKLYYVNRLANVSETIFPSPMDAINDTYYFGNKVTGFQIDKETNLLKTVVMNGVTINITQNFFYYKSEIGQFDASDVSSGAYIFRPIESSPEPIRGVINAGIIRTDTVEEFDQKWTDKHVNVSQIIRVYKQGNYIEFDWLVGGINIEDEVGKEVITKYTVEDFNNEKVFYTDSNGRETIKRVLNSRPDYVYCASIDPVASNYYPVTSRIMIKDEHRDIEVAILTDRSQGGSSMDNGQVELMIHRRILKDDHKGVAESLNETEFGSGVYVRGSHYLVFGTATKTNPDGAVYPHIFFGKTTIAQQRILAQKKLLQPWVGVGNADSDSLTLDSIKKKLKLKYSALRKDLRESINILTYEPWRNDSYLLRLEHIFEAQDDSLLSNIATIKTSDLFAKFEIEEISETTLGANEWLKDYKSRPKYNWKTIGQKMVTIPSVNDTSEEAITLTPMQIRTFIVKVSPVASKAPKSFTGLTTLIIALFCLVKVLSFL
ncbi:hypothetical protein NQ315_004621 [Exocentrus adspersus]|uniref:alpha-mannosidase n=1 Tax=Exocentrus adspersus TaxID=1586481 RepID=A0AAV8VP47_9CUCU|nr:hypothetical protein NQ315_004621 [Exocentrus adspersus]